MTKKFGDHKYDKYICTTLPHRGKYVIQQNVAPYILTYPENIKDARKLISFNELGYLLATQIGKEPTSSSTGMQARPAASPAAKVHVPKGKSQQTNTWPFPATKAKVAKPAKQTTVFIGAVAIEYDANKIVIEKYSNFRAKVTVKKP